MIERRSHCTATHAECKDAAMAADRDPHPVPRVRIRVILALLAALVALPPLVDLSLSPRGRSFDYMAADAFYYLTVARNIAEHGSVSFDRQRPSNGFHPLWQFSLAAVYAAGSAVGLAPHHIVAITALLGLALLTGALLLIALALMRNGGLSVLYLSLPLGAYGAINSIMWWTLGPAGLAKQRGAEGTLPLYGTIWSYANGMESAVLVLCFAAACYWYTKKPVLIQYRSAAIFGAMLALLIFSRLDHALFVAPTLAVLALLSLTSSSVVSRRHVGVIILCVAVPILLYMAVNQFYVGSAMPVSGKLKTSFPHFTSANIDLFGKWRDAVVHDRKWLHLGWRTTQLFIPLIVAILYLLTTVLPKIRDAQLWLQIGDADDRGDRFEHVMLLSALGVIALASYNILFVSYGHQGHWYLPLSTLFVSLAVLRWCERLGLGRLCQRTPRRFIAAAVILCAVTLLFFARLHRTADYHKKYADFYFDIAPGVRTYLAKAQDTEGVFSVDDGIVAFALDTPTMSGTGLVGDSEMVAHAQARTTGNLAVERGFNLFTSLVYYDVSRFTASTAPEAVGRWMSVPFRLKQPQNYDFEVAYRAPEGGFALIRVTAKPKQPQ